MSGIRTQPRYSGRPPSDWTDDEREFQRAENQREFREWRYRHIDEAIARERARQDTYQAETRATAARHGQEWTESDQQDALSLGDLKESAASQGRTYAAVRQGRLRLVRQHGRTNTLIKDQWEEYTSLMRRKDFTLEDLDDHYEKWGRTPPRKDKK